MDGTIHNSAIYFTNFQAFIQCPLLSKPPNALKHRRSEKENQNSDVRKVNEKKGK